MAGNSKVAPENFEEPTEREDNNDIAMSKPAIGKKSSQLHKRWRRNINKGKDAWLPQKGIFAVFSPRFGKKIDEPDKNVSDLKFQLEQNLQKKADDGLLPYLKKGRRRRKLAWRILSGSWFTEPRIVSWGILYGSASTGDILLQRETHDLVASGGLTITPEVLLGMQYTLGGSYQSKQRRVLSWNRVGMIVAFPSGEKQLLSCGRAGFELQPLLTLLGKCGKSKVPCALRRMRYKSQVQRDDAVGSIIRLADAVRRDMCDWSKLLHINTPGSEEVTTNLQDTHSSSKLSSDDASDLEQARTIAYVVLERVQRAGLQLSQEQIAAARGEFIILCKNKRAEEETKLEDFKRKAAEEKKLREVELKINRKDNDNDNDDDGEIAVPGNFEGPNVMEHELMLATASPSKKDGESLTHHTFLSNLMGGDHMSKSKSKAVVLPLLPHQSSSISISTKQQQQYYLSYEDARHALNELLGVRTNTMSAKVPTPTPPGGDGGQESEDTSDVGAHLLQLAGMSPSIGRVTTVSGFIYTLS
eukprot:gene13216-27959_t